ncbi:Protein CHLORORESPIRATORY REDUCTION 41 chloroplastic [Euphorbia peplus]|nr:Protein CHLORORESPIRATORY REDUCTION 41 chloroplastic [Euphorbia peplus]
MASTFLKPVCESSPIILLYHHHHHHQIYISTSNIQTRPRRHSFITKCTINNSTPEPINAENESPKSSALNSAETFPIEKRRKSDILRERKLKQEMTKGEPPSFEVGWKRSKKIQVEKPKGYVIMDFLGKLEELMGREYGSTALLAKVGEIVAERAREEAEILKEEGKVEERMVTELCRVLKLLEMDLAMVKASVKQDTLGERLELAKARCRQAILVANSF